MSYIVLARKYRPQTFDEVVGQGHITELLKKSIESKRLAHAYLFCGPRGIGKTSCARILSKSLNCQNGPTANPCGKCSSCVEITSGNNFDVIEIDGASNRGIDEIRSLRENVKFAPTYGRYKIYIVDEVHMLTTEAFNALLKTLEEPPECVKFIFATTEPDKVPATIISRCQKFDFKRVSIKSLAETLTDISKKEKLKIDQDAGFSIAKAAKGSVRDALSILDQLSALSQQTIKNSDVSSMLGLVETDLIFSLTDALISKNCSQCLQVLDDILEQGKDPKQLTRNLIEHFRNLMILKIGGKSLGSMIDHPLAVKETLLKQSEETTLSETLKAIDILVDVTDVSRAMDSVRIPLEVAFAKLTYTSEPKDVVTSQEKPKEALKKFIPMEKIINEKGHLDFSLDKKSESLIQKNLDPVEKVEDDCLLPVDTKTVDSLLLRNEPLTLEYLKKIWDSVTFAVSRKKMSVATYLQEGVPFEVSDTKIVIGFSKKAAFHKEALEEKQNTALIRDVIEEKLGTKVSLFFKIIDDHAPMENAPLVENALNKFQGKIVSQWHREGK
ncbi:MAG: DNA polymerase III subunit gamma/tau [Candidatus Omnitrophica bacterium]|nr:DNA polymerase III subunit gamma/tau [Candidatus Omnitrophota bacterium]